MERNLFPYYWKQRTCLLKKCEEKLKRTFLLFALFQIFYWLIFRYFSDFIFFPRQFIESIVFRFPPLYFWVDQHFYWSMHGTNRRKVCPERTLATVFLLVHAHTDRPEVERGKGKEWKMSNFPPKNFKNKNWGKKGK